MFRKILSFASSGTCEALCRPQIPGEHMVRPALIKSNLWMKLFLVKKSSICSCPEEEILRSSDTSLSACMWLVEGGNRINITSLLPIPCNLGFLCEYVSLCLRRSGFQLATSSSFPNYHKMHRVLG